MGNCSSKENVVPPSRNHGKVSNKSGNKSGIKSKNNNDSSSLTRPTSSDQENNSTTLIHRKNILYPTVSHELKWKFLHNNYVSKIVDPADVHCVLDECLKDTIQKLHSAEMTLLSRRVRKVVRKLVVSDPNNNHTLTNGVGMMGANNNGVSSSSSSHLNNTNNNNTSSSSSASSPVRTSSKKKLLKKVSKPSSSNIIDPLLPLDQLSPALAETRSKQIYQKDFVLDEFLMRQIFMGGNQILYLGSEEDWTKQSLEMYIQRKDNHQKDSEKKIEGSSSVIGLIGSFDSSNVNNSICGISMTTATTTASQSDRNIHREHTNNEHDPKHEIIAQGQKYDVNSDGEQEGENGSKTSRISKRRNLPTNIQNNQQYDDITSSSSAVGNVFGNAYQLLLYLSEQRWDYVADIAKLSAENAGLVLDVNEQTRKKEHLKYEEKQTMINEVEEKKSTESVASIPLPPHECPSEQNYNLSKPPPVLPDGISLQEVSFLVALALRGSRNKRLVLLFYLLLSRDSLVEILDNHPGGGVPTWLLEVDNDWILSYASLSHYFYYGGMPPLNSYCDSSNRSNQSGDSQAVNNKKSVFSPTPHLPPPQASNKSNTDIGYSTSLKEVKVNTLCAIETIAVLLHNISRKSPKNNDNDDNDFNKIGQSTTTRQKSQRQGGSSIKPNRERAMSYSDKKYHAANMHLMLTDYLRKLQQNPHEAPSFENDAEQVRKLEILDRFWDVSKPIYSRCKNLSTTDIDKDLTSSWTIEEFFKWADDAIPDDTCLDHIMHQLFGLGVLPSAAMERKLVCESWVDWQSKKSRFIDFSSHENHDTFSVMSLSIKNLLSFSSSRDSKDWEASSSSDNEFASIASDDSPVWGGIGGFDGRGGLGFGLMYCVDKQWWDRWARYVGWEWNDCHSDIISRNRPHGLTNENLIDHNANTVARGTLGSYELMKKGLKKDVDYELVPPRVWDILYELYGGGPPLPRMIMKMSKSYADNSSIDMPPHGKLTEKPMKVPKQLHVLTHPWIIECRVCDPHQPYRRGEQGTTSIRIMVSSTQSLWRLFSEIVVRLPIIHQRGKNAKGRGCARLWRRVQIEHDSSPKNSNIQTYGPWELLCKEGTAEFPVSETIKLDRESNSYFQNCWEVYACNHTVESIGLQDGDKLLFEYALVGKDDNFTWPREAAATAGKQIRDNLEEKLFRQKLRGLDADGKLVKNVKALIGTVVDAMDSSGRWYQAEITDVDNSLKGSTDIDSDDETCASESYEEIQSRIQSKGEIRAIRVDFSDVGGEEEWILVNSDRLAMRERFTYDSMKSVDQLDTGKTSNQSKSNSLVLRKSNTNKSSTNQPKSSGCTYAGFGACGLYNLGNTCYSNSALQCISYIPLLRAYLLSRQYERNGDLNRDNPLGTGGHVLEVFAELLRGMWGGKSGALQPLRFRQYLVRAKQRYCGTEQQDAQELLNDILDILHEDSNKVVKKPYVEAIEDKWVSNTTLIRVGEEAWRRYIRRNRSIVANLCMGQVLNSVTCPITNYTSRIFEPFNVLSLPLPYVTEVYFRCVVVRRASVVNCSKSLMSTDKMRSRFQKLPEQSVAEEYILPMSRVADISELKIHLVRICGISGDRLKLYTITKGSVEDMASKELSFGILQDKQSGPCWQLAQTEKPDEPNNKTTTIMAFESTLSARPDVVSPEDDSALKKDGSSSSDDGRKLIEETLGLYGDDLECHLFDTNPSHLSKAISKILWPKSASDFTVGLRVDAIDQRNKWFPGTIIEVVHSSNVSTSNHAPSKDPGFHVKIHFDNFSAKWDILYTLEDIQQGKVLPLYSNVLPKDDPFEIQVFHSQSHDPFNFFGLPFFVHNYVEWTSARAGAQIIAQTARFLESGNQTILFQNSDKVQCSNKYSGISDVQKKINEARNTLSKTINVLLDADRKYISLLLHESKHDTVSYSDEVSVLKAKLERKMEVLISLLPFNIMIYEKDQSSTTEKTRGVLTPFPFILDNTIGNCMNARQEIAICWKEVKKVTTNEIISFHSELPIDTHEESYEYFRKRQDQINKMNGGSGLRALNLTSCLDEFCNEQQLDECECWRCPKCKEVREGKQRMALWRLPDVLTFHLKRFNSSSRWREKITNKVNFPLTGLNMKEWCDKQSPLATNSDDDDCIYDLIGVINHYGGMTSGHYTAVVKATACSPEGSEEVEHYFNGAGVHAFGGTDEKEVQSALWKLIRSKEKDANTIQARAAQAYAKSTAESCEPLWLVFDDERVEPIPPNEVVSSTAYVLFYRRRKITPFNIAKYSTNE